MVDALIFVALTGAMARLLLSGRKPGWLATGSAGLLGALLTFALGHGIFGLHQFHLFAAESLLPAIALCTVLLVCLRRVTRDPGHRTIFT